MSLTTARHYEFARSRIQIRIGHRTERGACEVLQPFLNLRRDAVTGADFPVIEPHAQPVRPQRMETSTPHPNPLPDRGGEGEAVREDFPNLVENGRNSIKWAIK